MILNRTEKNVVFLIYNNKKQANSVSKFYFIQHQHIVKRLNHFKKNIQFNKTIDEK